MASFKFKKDEKVIVISGKDKGKKGTILKILPEKNRVLISGVNMHVKHMKPNKLNPQGGRVNIESPIHVSNVLHLDPKVEQATRIGYKFDVDGKKTKYSKKSKENISV